MVGHGGSSAGSYLANPTSPIPSHCASIVVTSTLRVKYDGHGHPYELWYLDTYLKAIIVVINTPHAIMIDSSLWLKFTFSQVTVRNDQWPWPPYYVDHSVLVILSGHKLHYFGKYNYEIWPPFMFSTYFSDVVQESMYQAPTMAVSVVKSIQQQFDASASTYQGVFHLTCNDRML